MKRRAKLNFKSGKGISAEDIDYLREFLNHYPTEQIITGVEKNIKDEDFILHFGAVKDGVEITNNNYEPER